MPKFLVRFTDSDNMERESVLSCHTEDQARRYCAGKGYKVLEIRLGKPRIAVQQQTDLDRPLPEVERIPSRKDKPPRVSKRELAIAFSQIAMMFGQGVPIHTALRIAGESGSVGLDRVLKDVIVRVETGSMLSTSMALHQQVFPDYVRSVVQMGEKSGRLTNVLHKLSDWLEKGNDIQRRMWGALLYPAVTLAICLLMAAFMFSVMLPSIVGSLQMTDAQTPLLTRVLMTLATSWWVRLGIVLGVLGGVILGRWISRDEQRKKTFSGLIFRLPVVGRLAYGLVLARWLERLAMVLDSGIDLYYALRLTSRIYFGPTALIDALPRIADYVRLGDTFSDALSRHPEAFPGGLRSLVAVAEETAGIQATLESYGRILETDMAQQIDAVLDLLEPLMMCFLGLLIGLMVLAIFLPIYASTTF